MAETLSGVNGKIIQWAREYYNMSYEEAAQRIGVDVDKYKLGKWYRLSNLCEIKKNQ